MTGLAFGIGILAFIGLLVALAGPVRSYFSDRSKLFLENIPAESEEELEDAIREAALPVPGEPVAEKPKAVPKA